MMGSMAALSASSSASAAAQAERRRARTGADGRERNGGEAPKNRTAGNEACADYAERS